MEVIKDTERMYTETYYILCMRSDNPSYMPSVEMFKLKLWEDVENIDKVIQYLGWIRRDNVGNLFDSPDGRITDIQVFHMSERGGTYVFKDFVRINGNDYRDWFSRNLQRMLDMIQNEIIKTSRKDTALSKFLYDCSESLSKERQSAYGEMYAAVRLYESSLWEERRKIILRANKKGVSLVLHDCGEDPTDVSLEDALDAVGSAAK